MCRPWSCTVRTTRSLVKDSAKKSAKLIKGAKEIYFKALKQFHDHAIYAGDRHRALMAWAKHAAGCGLTLEQIRDELPFYFLTAIRDSPPHEANLFDLAAKYAEVVSESDIAGLIASRSGWHSQTVHTSRGDKIGSGTAGRAAGSRD